MALAVDSVLVVKHTFLEFVDGSSGPSGDASCRSRARSMSDTGFQLPAAPVPQLLAESPCAVVGEDGLSCGSTRTGMNSDDESVPKSSTARSRRLSSWADESPSDDEIIDQKTTVIFRNIPNDYSREMLQTLFDNSGFMAKYNFIYLPVDFRSCSGFGYAFVDLVNGEVAEAFRQRFNGFCDWAMPSQKVAEVAWSFPSQGLEVHVERYRNSPVMHDAVQDMFKPAIFQNGKRVPFPLPTKAIRAPRIRHNTKRH